MRSERNVDVSGTSAEPHRDGCLQRNVGARLRPLRVALSNHNPTAVTRPQRKHNVGMAKHHRMGTD